MITIMITKPGGFGIIQSVVLWGRLVSTVWLKPQWRVEDSGWPR
jgi:hypothetical protein